jgi:hypothetical protein
MTNNSLISPVPDQTEISDATWFQELVSRIANLISVEEMYFNHFNHQEADFKELIILIPKSSRLHIMEARPLVCMVISGYPEYKFRLFYADEVQAGLTHGSMSFFNACKPAHLVYKTSGSSFVLSPPSLTAEEIRNKAILNFKNEQHKIAGFREGVEFYMRKGNRPMATLMLHQVMELSYRSAELIMVGREKISHRIRNHQKYLQPYLLAVSRVFNERDEQDMKLLDLLDDAYHTVRYEDNYEIDKDQLDCLIVKANLLEQLLAETYQIIFNQFEGNGYTPKNS